MTSINIKNVSKSYSNKGVLESVSLTIPPASFFFLLGPSGCGKTTLLRIVAGLEDADSGEIFINGNNVSKSPPSQRDIGMMFQNYALWPHLNVFDNIAYPLRCKQLSEPEIKKSVNFELEKISMNDFAVRFPSNLSGGQQQRVALARALVAKPKVVLLDEPLSNLDTNLRSELLQDMINIHKNLQITFIYVTHSKAEALSASSSGAIMNRGKIDAKGDLNELFYSPNTRFCADFFSEGCYIQGKFIPINSVKIVQNGGDLATVKKIIHHAVCKEVICELNSGESIKYIDSTDKLPTINEVVHLTF